MSAPKSHRRLAEYLDGELLFLRIHGREITPELIHSLSKTYAGRLAQLHDALDDLVSAVKDAIRGRQA